LWNAANVESGRASLNFVSIATSNSASTFATSASCMMMKTDSSFIVRVVASAGLAGETIISTVTDVICVCLTTWKGSTSVWRKCQEATVQSVRRTFIHPGYLRKYHPATISFTKPVSTTCSQTVTTPVRSAACP